MSTKQIGIFDAINVKLPLRTCLFVDEYDTWSFFSKAYSLQTRNKILAKLKSWNCNTLIFLTSNTDSRVPVSIFEFGRHGEKVDYSYLGMIVNTCYEIYRLGGILLPVLFCDDGDNVYLQNASDAIQEHYVGTIVVALRPFVPAFLIGLESNEYFDKARHEYFIRLIKRFAPELYIGTHLQKDIRGGIPSGLDFIAFEHSWCPTLGDNHTPEEVVQEVEIAKEKYKLPIIPVEYNTNVEGERAKAQSRALLQKGYSIGTPI